MPAVAQPTLGRIGVVGGRTPKSIVMESGALSFFSPFCADPMSGRAKNVAQTPAIRARLMFIELLLCGVPVRSLDAAAYSKWMRFL
jgi:hypothetical protein